MVIVRKVVQISAVWGKEEMEENKWPIYRELYNLSYKPEHF